MLKLKRTFLTVALLTSILLSACGKTEKAGDDESFVYCLNESGTGLIKIPCDIPEEDTQKAAEAVLEKLSTPAEEIDYINPIPEDVKVQDCRLTGGILEVDFSAGYLELEKIQEILMRAAIVQSLIQINGVNAVAFFVDNEPLKDGEGIVVGLMNGDDFVETAASSPTAYQTDTLTLYFANKSGDQLVAEKRDVRYSSNVSKDKLIVEKLMQGPDGSGGYPTINPNANLLSVTTKDKICYVNFDSTFLTGAYDILPELTVYSIVNSLVEGTEATQVQITINGESKDRYMDSVNISQPLSADKELVAADKNSE